jgi:transposase
MTEWRLYLGNKSTGIRVSNRRWLVGLPVICIDARHAKAALKLQINKSDRNDAVGIARIMQCGWYKEVRVKDLDSHALKALLVSRALLVKIKRDMRTRSAGSSRTSGSSSARQR